MSRPARILFVDDEQHVLNALRRVFRKFDHEVETFTSAVQALAAMEQAEPFHVIVSDYRMPEMNGVAFLKIVRHRWPNAVRIILSGYAETNAILAATNEGNIFKFIPKPWDEQQLIEIIDEALEQYAVAERQRTLLNRVDLMKECLTRGEHDSFKELCVYQTLMDQMPVGLIGIDHENTIVRMNQCAYDRLKLPANLLGQPADALPEPFRSALHPSSDQQRDAGTMVEIDNKRYLILTANFRDNEMEGVIMLIVLVPSRTPS